MGTSWNIFSIKETKTRWHRINPVCRIVDIEIKESQKNYKKNPLRNNHEGLNWKDQLNRNSTNNINMGIKDFGSSSFTDITQALRTPWNFSTVKFFTELYNFESGNQNLNFNGNRDETDWFEDQSADESNWCEKNTSTNDQVLNWNDRLARNSMNDNRMEMKDFRFFSFVDVFKALRKPWNSGTQKLSAELYNVGSDEDDWNFDDDEDETDSFGEQSEDDEPNWWDENTSDDGDDDDDDNDDGDDDDNDDSANYVDPQKFIVDYTKRNVHYYCVLCGCHLHGDRTVKQHVYGKRHFISVLLDGSDILDIEGNRQYYCLCCMCRISGYGSVHKHVNGKMHLGLYKFEW